MSLFLPKDVTTSHHDIIWYDKVNLHRSTHLNIWKSRFFNLATLTFDLWPWHSNSSKILLSQSFHQILDPYVKRFSRGGADRHTDRQTWPILYPRPLTREGKIQCSQKFFSCDNWLCILKLGRKLISPSFWWLIPWLRSLFNQPCEILQILFYFPVILVIEKEKITKLTVILFTLVIYWSQFTFYQPWKCNKKFDRLVILNEQSSAEG